MDKDKRIGIIGCGHMGEIITKNMIVSGLVTAMDVFIFDIDTEKTKFLKERLDLNIATSVEQLCNQCNVIILAVKPQDIDEVLKAAWHVLDSSKLIISIAAGATTKKIKSYLNDEARIVRVMPNMAAAVNKCVAAICSDNYADPGDKAIAKQIFLAMGDVIEIEEELMDAVTAISGSGPAYFFYLTELLEKCAADMGISKDKAKLLAVKTFIGAAAMMAENQVSAEELKRRVTSKGGTTDAAFRHFKENKLEAIFKNGVDAARKRAKELSEGA